MGVRDPTACGHRMAQRKWKATKLQPGTGRPGNMLGCCLVSSHFLLAILCPQAVNESQIQIGNNNTLSKNKMFRNLSKLNSNISCRNFPNVNSPVTETRTSFDRGCHNGEGEGYEGKGGAVCSFRFQIRW